MRSPWLALPETYQPALLSKLLAEHLAPGSFEEMRACPYSGGPCSMPACVDDGCDLDRMRQAQEEKLWAKVQ